ncbi:APA family basic amino acid/polyamine antiporter [Rhizomicrobium palustre]|uniref:APA family basic amino acid/polyamine antiporter n=1 Tax=Rhizomicrobium palustre TaxID=189966 RepID=A0A846MW39_9PROT|nr:amino acid permease [Rhizomicrobium palustre]NIK87292.1 APA family basic amino acid/polyamine antiporter [Rhizomicrobium palustre]
MRNFAAVFRRLKPIESVHDNPGTEKLVPTLSWHHLVALGVGGIVGTGIYTLIGQAAGLAGPGMIVSFIIAGLVSACAALAYAEMATMMPAAGSAYTYSYVVMGEPIAWLVGWSLILEYTVVCAAVAVGWSAYAAGFMAWLNLPIVPELLKGPSAGGIINLPAVGICLAVAGLLAAGTRESATVNFVLVILKLAALAAFVALALPAFNSAHFTPFLPYGWSSMTAAGVKLGVLPAASLIFFAFYGFDTISTAAEEAKRPGRDLSVGIVGSMLLCTVIYIAVALAAIGAVPVAVFAPSAEPLALILRTIHQENWSAMIGLAAIIAFPTVIMVFMYGQSRIFFVMARDRLLPGSLAKVNSRTGTPIAVTIFTGVVSAVISGLAPLSEIAQLANSGTLCAFIAVALSMMIFRVRDPARKRVFKTPLWGLVGTGAIVGCLYLFASLPLDTQIRFVIWNAIGLVVYLAYSVRKSRLAK